MTTKMTNKIPKGTPKPPKKNPKIVGLKSPVLGDLEFTEILAVLISTRMLL